MIQLVTRYIHTSHLMFTHSYYFGILRITTISLTNQVKLLKCRWKNSYLSQLGAYNTYCIALENSCEIDDASKQKMPVLFKIWEYRHELKVDWTHLQVNLQLQKTQNLILKPKKACKKERLEINTSLLMSQSDYFWIAENLAQREPGYLAIFLFLFS